MQHDTCLRAMAHAIYDAVYPSEDWAPVGFAEAERCRTVHYRQAVAAAQASSAIIKSKGEQLALFGAA